MEGIGAEGIGAEEIGWEPVPRSPVTRAVLRAGAVTVLAALAAGPGSAVPVRSVPLSRTAVEAELDAAAEQAGVRRDENVGLGFVVTADEESDRPGEECMLARAAAGEDGAREYTTVATALGERGWGVLRRGKDPDGTYVRLGKGGWTVTVSYGGGGPESFPSLTFTAMAHTC
ncbi:hypothetical protein ABZZ36_42555 [Actinacidiphila glaucinigra]|uniref:hypothetical protein n=1 Tax=Actinacidiphila glaucinigra TaxID=235986 RepID=UPI0033B18B75